MLFEAKGSMCNVVGKGDVAKGVSWRWGRNWVWTLIVGGRCQFGQVPAGPGWVWLVRTSRIRTSHPDWCQTDAAWDFGTLTLKEAAGCTTEYYHVILIAV